MQILSQHLYNCVPLCKQSKWVYIYNVVAEVSLYTCITMSNISGVSLVDNTSVGAVSGVARFLRIYGPSSWRCEISNIN